MKSSRIRAGALAALLCLGTSALLFGESTEVASHPRVNINTATAAELAYLPRLGQKVAARIVEHRKEKPFARPEDLMEVKGIGEKLFTQLKPYVAVSGPTTLSAKVRSGSSTSRRSSPAAASKEKPASTVPVGKGR
ncbi:MAG: helix-hairpin-helix domain-containing protein [Syntrophomonadaceae bacterium]